MSNEQVSRVINNQWPELFDAATFSDGGGGIPNEADIEVMAMRTGMWSTQQGTVPCIYMAWRQVHKEGNAWVPSEVDINPNLNPGGIYTDNYSLGKESAAILMPTADQTGFDFLSGKSPSDFKGLNKNSSWALFCRESANGGLPRSCLYIDNGPMNVSHMIGLIGHIKAIQNGNLTKPDKRGPQFPEQPVTVHCFTQIFQLPGGKKAGAAAGKQTNARAQQQQAAAGTPAAPAAGGSNGEFDAECRAHVVAYMRENGLDSIKTIPPVTHVLKIAKGHPNVRAILERIHGGSQAFLKAPVAATDVENLVYPDDAGGTGFTWEYDAAAKTVTLVEVAG